MTTIIKDGTGSGYSAKINSQNQLITGGTVSEQRTLESLRGHYIEATTGMVELTDAYESALLLITNNTDGHYIVDRVFVDCFASTGGTGPATIRYYFDAVVVGGASATITNTLAGSGAPSGISATKSMTSFSGSSWWLGVVPTEIPFSLSEGRIAIPQGHSFLVSITAPAGNTSMNLNINIATYSLDFTEISG